MTVQKAINLNNGPKWFCLNPVTFSRGLSIVDIGMSKVDTSNTNQNGNSSLSWHWNNKVENNLSKKLF